MIVTEKEASTKRCQEGFAAATGISADGIPVMQPELAGPIVHHSAAGYYGVSRGGAPMNCIGSGCMAWRWHAWTEYLKGDIGENDFVATPLVSATHGYCGKAGRQLAVGKLGEAE